MIALLAALLLGTASAAGRLAPEEAFAAGQSEYAAERMPTAECKNLKGARCGGFSFKSKKPAETDSRGRKTWLRFSLVVTEHPSEAAAAADFAKLAKELGDPQLDPYSKAPEYWRLSGKKVYGLYGACLFAGKRWRAMIKALDAELGAPTDATVAQCGCGTGCWAGVR